MAKPTLPEIVERAGLLAPDKASWLLEASALAAAVNEAVLDDPVQLEAVRRAVQAAAEEAGCDLIVGASEAADQVVRGIPGTAAEPSKALLLELACVTGSTITLAAEGLPHLETTAAVLVDLRGTSTAVGTIKIALPELIRC